jgi:predicted ATPase
VAKGTAPVFAPLAPFYAEDDDRREKAMVSPSTKAPTNRRPPFRQCCHDNALLTEDAVLANENGALFWNARGMMTRGYLLALTGKAAEAVEKITTGMTAYRLTGAIVFVPFYLSHLALAKAELGLFDDARRGIDEALTVVETAKERWCEAEIHRIAGGIELKSPQPDAAKAEAHFECALAIARAQQAKSLELRAAMSIARLWLDRGQREAARALLEAVYGWFTEGFNTLDLREAKLLLDALD